MLGCGALERIERGVLGHTVVIGPADNILLAGGVVHGVRSVDAVGLAKVDDGTGVLLFAIGEQVFGGGDEHAGLRGGVTGGGAAVGTHGNHAIGAVGHAEQARILETAIVIAVEVLVELLRLRRACEENAVILVVRGVRAVGVLQREVHAVGDVAVVGLILAGGVAIVGGDGRGLRGGQHLYGEGLGNGLDAGETVLGELDGDGTGRGLVAIDGDLAILDGYVLSGRNRGGSAIHSRREGVSGTHDGRNHVAGRDFLELFSGSFRGRVDRDREFLRSGLATDRDGGGQRDSLGCLALGGLVDRAVSRDDAAIGGRPRHAVRSGQRNERIVDRRGDDDAVQHGTGEFTGMN